MVRLTLIALMLAGAVFTFHGCATEEEPPKQGAEEQRMDVDEHTEAMMKQHKSMLDIQREWDEARRAVETGRGAEAADPARGIEESSEYMEKFMLHKNPEKRDEFLRKAREFKSLIMDFRQYAEKGDVKSLREVAPEIDKACNGCHQSFR